VSTKRARRAVITGSESTGKTSLAPRLAAHFGTVWTTEYAREHLDRKQRETGQGLDASDVEPIARGQVAEEDRQAREANRLLVLDTDLVSTVVYARHYYGHCPAWIEQAARERLADLYLLLAPDVPWTPDPQRDRGGQREEMHALFRATLEEFGAHVVEISGDWPERFTSSVAAIERLLQEDRPL
jgi:NadR type nicotinamide-nucleotide adenylyltransferase